LTIVILEYMKAVIIGSGIGGMASAIRMASMGFETHVFEQNTKNVKFFQRKNGKKQENLHEMFIHRSFWDDSYTKMHSF